MSNSHLSNSLCALSTVLFLALLLTPCLALGEQNTEDTLSLFTAWQEQSSTASRVPKPLSQTAENVTVVTAKEIEALNAHTLADVLATVSGIQTEHLGGPGSLAIVSIQSSANNHVLVMVDGVPLNTLGENYSDISLIPAGIIERIEIVKGAASSSWGQALGGVINVITKVPEQGRTIGGTASASIGERTTADTHAELTGSSGRLGYYLSGGYLGSNGLLPFITTYSNYAYAKLTYDLPEHGSLWGTVRYANARRGDTFVPYPDFDYKQASDYLNLYATLGYRRNLTEHLQLELLAHHATRNLDSFYSMISDGSPILTIFNKERVSGADVKLIWRGDNNLLVAGGDYEHDEIKSTGAITAYDTLDRAVDRWGVYLNDTITLGPVAVTPGGRFDHTVSSGDQFSPSLGATWQLSDSTLLRGYVARGYSLPTIVLQNRSSEKVLTYQVGIETQAVPYLWLKETLFRNETWNLQQVDPYGSRHIAMGSELEVRTVPVFNTSLGAGYTFTDTIRTNTGSQVYGAPRHTLQLALRYDDMTFRGVLTGRHIWWNQDPTYMPPARYYGLIWDLHLGATLLKRENSALELFFSGHNLFNGTQTQDGLFPNPGRWFEGGMKVRF